MNLITWHCRTFRLQSGQLQSCLAGFGFDASAWEIWPPLCVGGVLVFPPSATRDPEALLAWWKDQDHELSLLPTPIADLAFAQGMVAPKLRTLLVGGDRLNRLPSPESQVRVINNYGPTESTVVATSGAAERSEAVPSIGRPIDNTRIYILGGQGEPVPVGVTGEIHIGGIGLARGYFNRPGLTAQRFLSDPFSREPGARMYRTGDLARWLGDGRIDYIGRNDFQVRFRGFRIELREIEARLSQHPAVAQCVVIARR
jgi:non-ribosomal peptide synthetase component F